MRQQRLKSRDTVLRSATKKIIVIVILTKNCFLFIFITRAHDDTQIYVFHFTPIIYCYYTRSIVDVYSDPERGVLFPDSK